MSNYFDENPPIEPIVPQEPTEAPSPVAVDPEPEEATTEEIDRDEDVVEIPSEPKSEPDRVAMVSYRADGTPDQTDDFEHLVEDEGADVAEEE